MVGVPEDTAVACPVARAVRDVAAISHTTAIRAAPRRRFAAKACAPILVGAIVPRRLAVIARPARLLAQPLLDVLEPASDGDDPPQHEEDHDRVSDEHMPIGA